MAELKQNTFLKTSFVHTLINRFENLSLLFLATLLAFAQFTLVPDFSFAASSCRAELSGKALTKELIKRQNLVMAQYQVIGERRILKRLDADIQDPTVPEVLRQVAQILKNEYQKIKSPNSAIYHTYASRYVGYLQYRFFSKINDKTAQQLMNAIDRIVELENETYFLDRPEFPVKAINFPGLASFEQMAEMRANGLSPVGSIEKISNVDGVPGADLAYFRRHDDAHFSDWLSQLDSNHRFYKMDLTELIIKTSDYFVKLKAKADSTPTLTLNQRRLMFFLYFYISHEKNIDVISSERWLTHLYRSLGNHQYAQDKLISAKIQDQAFAQNYSEATHKITNEIAVHLNWPFGEISKEDIANVISFIKGT
jgi:hypothetical protein